MKLKESGLFDGAKEAQGPAKSRFGGGCGAFGAFCVVCGGGSWVWVVFCDPPVLFHHSKKIREFLTKVVT